MINPMDLSGKRILVTGASSGIGRQTCITLSQLGAKVLLVARREEQLIETINMMEGKDHCYYPFDLCSIDQIDSLIKTIVRDHGAFDGFVHCAGVSTNRPLALFKHENVHQMMTINFYSFYETVRVISKKGNFNPGMSIVAMSSVAAVRGNSAQSVYAASKAAIDASVRCVAKELHTKEIRVNSIIASMIETEMYKGYLSTKGEVGNESLVARQYLGIGKPDDISNAIAYLLSSAAKFITGTQFVVDGGFTSSC